MATRQPAWKILLLAIGFVAVSLACKLVPWFGLGFLDERSIVRSGVAGLLALAATVAMTVLALRWKATGRLADSRLVAFSCKRRGFCPSCLGRRMKSAS